MEQKYPLEKNVLNLLSQAPCGMTLKDIKDTIESHKSTFGNWEQFIEDMLEQTAEENMPDHDEMSDASYNQSAG